MWDNASLMTPVLKSITERRRADFIRSPAIGTVLANACSILSQTPPPAWPGVGLTPISISLRTSLPGRDISGDITRAAALVAGTAAAPNRAPLPASQPSSLGGALGLPVKSEVSPPPAALDSSRG